MPKLIILLLSLVTLGSCESEIEDEPNNPETGPETKLDTVYINSQANFDTYKESKFPAGARIFFATGKVFDGQFAPTGSGTAEKPIKLTAYNPGSGEIYWKSIENKPVINGHGQVNSTFYLYNGGYLGDK